MSFVGLDLGGTYIKAARFDPLGRPSSVTRTRTPDFLEATGAVREIAPDALLRLARQALEAAVGGGPVAGILLTGQMAGTALTDVTGRALRPLITWQDTRATDVDALIARWGEEGPTIVHATGGELRIGLPALTLTSVQFPAGARYTSIMGYVAGRLCNGRATSLHATDAASSGMYDVINHAWEPRALMTAGLELEQMPKVCRDILPTGWSAEYDCPVYSPVGDQQAALLGAGLKPGEISMNIATGGQVSIISPSIGSPAQLRPYFGNDYLHTVTHLPSGRLLTAALRDTIGGQPTDDDWQRASDAVLKRDPAVRRISDAVETATAAYCAAARTLGVRQGTVLRFSGGLAQRFAPLRNDIAAALALPQLVYEGDDAALAGLGVLSLVLPHRTGVGG